MEITPEQRRRIYEEEKARIEGAETSTTITIPHLEASAMVKPSDAARLLAAARKK